MDDITIWFDPKIPIEYIVGSFLVLCIAIIVGIVVLDVHKIKRFVLYSLCAEYYFMILCSTVLCRSIQTTGNIMLIPFYKYPDIWNKVDHPNDLIEVSLNVVLFIPIGLLLGGAFYKWKWWQIALVGCSLSFIIELLQLITARGLCETDDLVHNTFGCIIGYGMYLMVDKVIHSIKSKQKN